MSICGLDECNTGCYYDCQYKEEPMTQNNDIEQRLADISIFDKYDLVEVDESFPIPSKPKSGLICLVGTSGSGKSTILREWFGPAPTLEWGEYPIYKQFDTEFHAEELLLACGLRTIPAWKRPYSQLSNGEQHRAACALMLHKNVAYIDEFTSVVDRDTAKALSTSINKYFRRSKRELLVIASCHRDIIEWLQPNMIYDTDLKRWLDGDCLRRPPIELFVQSCEGKEVWPAFQKHHYLSKKYNPAASAFVGLINGKPVAFSSVLSFPSGSFKNAYREHRVVVLPEFQGLGIGNAISETVAEYIVSQGYRLFSKTAHPAMGEHRNASDKWRPTSKNNKRRIDYRDNAKFKHIMAHSNRACYSHEYVGGNQ